MSQTLLHIPILPHFSELPLAGWVRGSATNLEKTGISSISCERAVAMAVTAVRSLLSSQTCFCGKHLGCLSLRKGALTAKLGDPGSKGRRLNVDVVTEGSPRSVFQRSSHYTTPAKRCQGILSGRKRCAAFSFIEKGIGADSCST